MTEPNDPDRYCVRFIVQMSARGYLLLDSEGEAEFTKDPAKATAFTTVEKAQKAAWGFQMAWYELYRIEARLDPMEWTKR